MERFLDGIHHRRLLSAESECASEGGTAGRIVENTPHIHARWGTRERASRARISVVARPVPAPAPVQTVVDQAVIRREVASGPGGGSVVTLNFGRPAGRRRRRREPRRYWWLAHAWNRSSCASADRRNRAGDALVEDVATAGGYAATAPCSAAETGRSRRKRSGNAGILRATPDRA